tara:strand:- start:418 stop:852 length:435 start_codon:yes stop_codon:yes gene_type:complete
MATEVTGLMILPAIGLGLILGIYEMILIKGDENFSGSHWFGHGLHIFPTIVVACLISFNIGYFITMAGDSLPPLLTNELFLRIALGLVVAVKVWSASAVVPGGRGKGMHESVFHVLLIGALVAGSPYLWPFVGPYLPTWLGGGQ